MNGIKAEDRIGTVINGWKIIGITGKTKNNRTLCEVVSTITGKVITNVSISNISTNHYSHFRYYWRNKRLRDIFRSMKRRCYDIKTKGYKDYGGRGITVYQEWLDNPQAFEEWALEHGYRDDLTIDRLDVDGNYEPSNCRWISNQENAKWTRQTKHIWIENYVDSAAGWSKKIKQCKNWFSEKQRCYGFNYAYQKLLEKIEKLGGIKKVMGVAEEHDISKFLEDIENDRLEIDL